MPVDLLALQTGFSGVQLIVMAYMLIELNHSKAAYTKQGRQIDKLNSRVAHMMGKFSIPMEDGDQ